MPAHAGPLKAKPPKKRDPRFSDGCWEFPKRLEKLAGKWGWKQADVSRIAGISQTTVSRWMTYKVFVPDRAAVRKLELKGGVAVGSLLSEPADAPKADGSLDLTKLRALLDRLGLDDTVISALKDEALGSRMNRFEVNVRRAILGLVHVHGVNLERAADIADEVLRENPKYANDPDLDPSYWFGKMATKVSSLSGKKESGSYPSLSSIKL